MGQVDLVTELKLVTWRRVMPAAPARNQPYLPYLSYLP
jgi:hypothetical protein